jgi:hypothetical protein
MYMRINTREILKNYDGTDIVNVEINGDGKETKRPHTVRDAIVTAINSQTRDDLLTAEQKIKVFGLSNKLYENQEEVDLTEEDVTFIKERSGKYLIPVVYGRLLEIFKKDQPAGKGETA